MTDYTRIRSNLMSNPKGIMESMVSFGIKRTVKSNVRLYFYRYDIYDLVEIEFKDDIICVFDYPHTEDRAIDIRDKLEYYAGYFKAGGLSGRRFLYDLSLKMPVVYDDFIDMKRLPNVERKEFAFILDKKKGYITTEGAVSTFISTERSPAVDKSILAFYNDFINVKHTTNYQLAGCMSSMLISGLLSNVSYKDIELDMDFVESDAKFIKTIEGVEINSDNVRSISSKLKSEKFKRIIQGSTYSIVPVKKGTVKGEVYLTNIIDVGLDKFTKSLKDEDVVVKVIIDAEQQTIKSAYIVRGLLVITPATYIPLNYFKDILNSDNIEYAMN